MKKLKKIWNALCRTQELTLWHPDSPGMKITVRRNIIERCLYSKDFATLTECIKFSKVK